LHANATTDINPVKDNVKINKLADNNPVHQTGTLKKMQFNALDGKVIFQIPRSTNGEPSATAVKKATANSDSFLRTYVSPSTVDLSDNDPALIIDSYSNGTKRNSCFLPLVPPGYTNNDRMSLTMALIDTLAEDDPYNTLGIVTTSMLLQGSTLDMMGEEMGSVGPKTGAG
jgi:Tfp pilus assembly major pilin PilA